MSCSEMVSVCPIFGYMYSLMTASNYLKSPFAPREHSKEKNLQTKEQDSLNDLASGLSNGITNLPVLL